MPPMLSDDEHSDVSSDELEPPVRKADKLDKASKPDKKESEKVAKGKSKQVEIEETEENGEDEGENKEGEGDDNDDTGDDEFVVEAIKQHMIHEGGLTFLVKWEGYDDPNDETWEPEDNLSENKLLDLYYAKFGGRDTILSEAESSAKPKKRGRKNMPDTPDANTNGKRAKKAHPSSSTPPANTPKWTPPSGSWEEDIESIDAIEDINGKRMVYVKWVSGNTTQHDTKAIYKHCPQKMLKFYESHLQVIPETRAREASVDVIV